MREKGDLRELGADNVEAGCLLAEFDVGVVELLYVLAAD